MVKIFGLNVFFYLIICIQPILISCDEDKQNEKNYFYEFDYVEHYYIDSDASKLIDYFPKYESCIEEVVYLEYENVGQNDSIKCYEELESFGYKKKVVPRIKYNELKELFVENEIKNKKPSFCNPVFRDILIMYRQSKKLDVISICFPCNEVHFFNAGYSTSGFGYNSEYDKLKKILY